MKVSVSVATLCQVPAAVEVWRAANNARGLTSAGCRVQRVVDKLRAAEAVVVIGWADAEAPGIALAEPGRADDGVGAVVPGWGHVSMVFVRPDLWGQGVGTALMTGLHEVADERSWTRTSLWTRASNERALRLYARSRYRATGRVAALASGEPIVQLARRRVAV